MTNFVQSPCEQAVIRAGATAVPCAKSSAPWILAATILGSSMAFIDGTVVNVALPALQWSLKATVVDVQWVVEAYSLLLASFLLVGGSLGDHYGRRRIFIVGVVLFSVASLWCGLATSIGQLILARAVQGGGADGADYRERLFSPVCLPGRTCAKSNVAACVVSFTRFHRR